MNLKNKPFGFLLLFAFALIAQGCVAFPPLIQVEHKDDPAGKEEILRRLDAIDHRLEALEQQSGKKP